MIPRIDAIPRGASQNGSHRRTPNGRSNSTILARDIMTRAVVAVQPEDSVRRIAVLLDEKNIGAVPVLDRFCSLIGIVSASDLIQRQELGAPPYGPSTVGEPGEPAPVAADYAKSHGMHAVDVMTKNVVTVSEDTPLADIARTLQTKDIGRVAVMRENKLVGMLTRSDIVHALAWRPEGSLGPVSSDDDMIRYNVIRTLTTIPGQSLVHHGHGVERRRRTWRHHRG